MSYFHPEEALQVAVLERHAFEHPGTRYLVEFSDGESYVCEYHASWESENTGDLNIEIDDPQYDEFYQVGFKILGSVHAGNRGYRGFFAVDYRDFPAKIIDIDTDSVVYPAPPRRA